MLGVYKIISFNFPTKTELLQLKAVYQDRIYGVKGFFTIKNTAIAIEQAQLQKSSYFLNKHSKFHFLPQTINEHDISIYFNLNCRDFIADNFLGTITNSVEVGEFQHILTLQTPFGQQSQITLNNVSQLPRKKFFALKITSTDTKIFINEPSQIQFITPNTAFELAKMCKFEVLLDKEFITFQTPKPIEIQFSIPTGIVPIIDFPAVQVHGIDFGVKTIRFSGDLFLGKTTVFARKQLVISELPRVKNAYLAKITNPVQLFGENQFFQKHLIAVLPDSVLQQFVCRFLTLLFQSEKKLNFDIFAVQIKPTEVNFEKVLKDLIFDCLVVDFQVVVGRIYVTRESFV